MSDWFNIRELCIVNAISEILERVSVGIVNSLSSFLRDLTSVFSSISVGLVSK